MTEQSKQIAPIAEPPAPQTAAPNSLSFLEKLDPVALTGTGSVPFAKRLALQVACCQVLPAQMTPRQRAEAATSAAAVLKALAPANAVEALLAAQAVAAHNASLDLLELSMGQGCERKSAETYARQHARLANLALRSLDQLVRLRGRQRQTVRIEHVRMVEDGTVTVRQEEERVRG